MHVFSLTVQVGGEGSSLAAGRANRHGRCGRIGSALCGRARRGESTLPAPQGFPPPGVRWLRGSSALRGPQEGLLLEGVAGLKNCEESTSRASLDASLLLKDGRGAPPSTGAAADASKATAGEPAPLWGGCCMLARPVSSAWQGAPAGGGRLRTWSSALGGGHTGRGAAAWGRADLGDSGWGCS